ncbi:alpha-amylase family glycosyl hydrolase [Propionivibrio sp.]|uniref:alpha-amylase family glycosyl hydrolase n=1 Tax=Propionivibrio sp. TaxID=2212460 RepID=UPI0025D9F0FE|nr:alpha-amylase family glycosyl hydrolase [Propionivibrio sp.]MBK7356637.1 alpha-amylase [Propionivibrio sp.]
MTIDQTTHDQLERSLQEIDWAALRRPQYLPSPAAWEDQVLYFLMLDRFSDGREQGFRDNDGIIGATGSTPPFRFTQNAYTADRSTWADAGDEWLGGTLKGLESKIGYLSRLGATAIWISPVFKQVASDSHSYHGYGIQNFLDIDPHFGTRQDLIDLVNTAHANGIRVILDIILNHSGNVFGYQFNPDRYPVRDEHGKVTMDPRWDGNSYPVEGWRNAFGQTNIPFGPINPATHGNAWPNDAVWPVEFQDAATFTAKGRINSWDNDPEFLEGDFVTLKDIHHGDHERDAQNRRIIDAFHYTPALTALCDVFKFWIALADVDGFRIDTVKHMEPGATRYFAAVIKEFAQSLGKENFFLVGEITGGRDNAYNMLELTGLDAALGIDDIPDRMDYLAKGWREPVDYFNLFRNSALVNKSSHVWFGKHVVTLFDDHDQVRKGNNKGRFCGDWINNGYAHLKAVLGLNLTSMGIPCIYYGTEQAFDGTGDNDRYLRECMFGGAFGSLQSVGRHFFDENHEIYRCIAEITALRKQHLALRRGRQYLREISASGESGSFGVPHLIGGQIRSVVPWSRLFDNQEVLLAINTDAYGSRAAWVTIDASVHAKMGVLACLYSTDPAQIGTVTPIEARNGRAVHIEVPAGGFVIYG